MVFPSIKKYCDALIADADLIAPQRKVILDRIGNHIRARLAEKKQVDLVYICTHNSRRSQFGQVWAQVAAAYYGIKNVSAFSGGTETTAFHVNALHALKKTGFEISKNGAGSNPEYSVVFDDAAKPLRCFSKTYDHPANPATNFIAIMTCSEAEQNCPFIANVTLRMALPYEDPGAYDGTSPEEEMYAECCRQIALETFYLFRKIDVGC